MRYADRTDAGRHLAALLRGRAWCDPVVLALPRGGVPVAAPSAAALGAPRQPELAIGAIAEPDIRVLDPTMLDRLRLDGDAVAAIEGHARRELQRRIHHYRGDRALPPLTGRSVVVSAGGTREPLDPVRYLGNRSSGKQGLALAETAAAAGAQVHLIAGIMDVQASKEVANITVEHIETAAQLQAAVLRAAPEADMLIMAAAVADFRPSSYAAQKIKKTDDGENPVIILERNPDILAETVQRRQTEGTGPGVIVGFAAETGSAEADPLELAQAKLLRKGCDLLVLNQVGEALVFGRDETEIHILTSPRLTPPTRPGEGSDVTTLRGTKHEAAAAIISAATAYVV